MQALQIIEPFFRWPRYELRLELSADDDAFRGFSLGDRTHRANLPVASQIRECVFVNVGSVDGRLCSQQKEVTCDSTFVGGEFNRPRRSPCFESRLEFVEHFQFRPRNLVAT